MSCYQLDLAQLMAYLIVTHEVRALTLQGRWMFCGRPLMWN